MYSSQAHRPLRRWECARSTTSVADGECCLVLAPEVAHAGEERQGHHRHVAARHGLDGSSLQRVGRAVEIVEQDPGLTEPEPGQPAAQRLGGELHRPASEAFRLGGVSLVLPDEAADAVVQAQQAVGERRPEVRLSVGGDRPARQVAVPGLDGEHRHVGRDSQDPHPVLGPEVVESGHRRRQPAAPFADVADPDTVHRAGQPADQVPPPLRLGPRERGPQVVLLALHVAVGIEVGELRRDRLHPREEVGTVAVAHERLLAGLHQLLGGVGPHGLEHPVAHVPAVLLADDQGLALQLQQRFERPGLPAHGQRRLGAEAAREHGEAAEHRSFLVAEESVAPVEGPVERPVARRLGGDPR